MSLRSAWTRVVCLAAVTAWGASFPSPASTAEPRDAAMDSRPAPEHETLIRQLGSRSFAAREAASRRLEGFGMAAQAAIRRGTTDPDIEIRLRAHALLIRLQRRNFEQQLADFLSDAEERRPHALPGWKPLREAIGASRESRQLFVHMLRAEPRLLEAHATHSLELRQVFSHRVAALLPWTESGEFDPRWTPPESLVALLLVGSDPAIASSSVATGQLYSLLTYADTVDAILSGPYAAETRALLERWVMIDHEFDASTLYPVLVSIKYDLREAGAGRARRAIRQVDQPQTIQYASIALGKFGDRSDQALLEPHVHNKSICYRSQEVTVQMRDIVLVMLLHLAGKNPREYGFVDLRPDRELVYELRSMGFADNQEREATHARAAGVWSDARSK